MTNLVCRIIFLLTALGVVVVTAWMISARRDDPVEAVDVDLALIEAGEPVPKERYVPISDYDIEYDRMMCVVIYSRGRERGKVNTGRGQATTFGSNAPRDRQVTFKRLSCSAGIVLAGC